MSKRTKRWRKRLKKTARSVISVGAKVSRVAIPLVSFAAGVLYGPAASAVVTAAAHYPHQWQETVRARRYGATGRDARAEGRVHAQRTTQHSIYAGLGGSTVALAVGGLGAGATGLVGQSQLGLGSGAGIIPGVSNPLISAPAPSGALVGAQTGASLGIQAAAPAKIGAAAGAQLGAGAGLAAGAPSLLGASPSILDSATKLLSTASAAKELYEKYRAKLPGDLGDITDKIPGFPGGGDSGGDSGGLGGQKDTTSSGTSDFATLALLLGGAYLVSKAA